MLDFVTGIGFTKCFLASSQAGSIGGAIRLGEFWEEEGRDRVASQTQDESALLRKVKYM